MRAPDSALVTADPRPDAVPVHVVPAGDWAAWLKDRDAEIKNWAAASGFDPANGLLLVPDTEQGLSAAVLATGPDDDSFAYAALSEKLPGGDYALADAAAADPELLALAWWLGAYSFDRYKEKKPARGLPRLSIPGAAGAIERARVTAEAVYLVRDLVTTPAEDMGPPQLEAAAEILAGRHGAECRAIVGDDLLSENFPMVHAVGRAAARAPRLIELTWGRADAPKLSLVGKGVCFDTGGLNIKSGAGMELMKKDMGGAANVLGLAHLVMAQKLDVRLKVLIPATENSISGNAFRPGDVLPSRKGLTVEIGNTDAEGRLILGDALAYADEDKPDLLIDMATLTGAARVALGPELPPFYTDDEELAAAVAAASLAAADPLWRMPLYGPYAAWLDSQIADISHISQGPFAGSITAALFLKRFVSESTPWAHFDIFAWIPKPKPGRPMGGEAQAIRALNKVLQDRYGG